jgi:hypothetical protein
MGYFEGLINKNFKKDRAGKTVFYPWSMLGSGRILENTEMEDSVRRLIKAYYASVFLAVLGLILSSAPLRYAFLALLPCIYAWYVYTAQQLVAQCRPSAERLTLKDTYAATAAANHEITLWLFFAVFSMLSAAGIWALFRPVPPDPALGKAVIALCVLLFGAAAAVYAYMLKLKRAQQGKPVHQ